MSYEEVNDQMKANDVIYSPGEYQGWAPLHFACSRGNVTVVQILLDNGACQTYQNAEGDTPQDIARRHE